MKTRSRSKSAVAAAAARKRRAEVAAIKASFLAALQRLLEGRPTHPVLLERAQDGGISVSVKTVALEAGHSRTLIGHAGCQLPDVRQAVLASKRIVSPPARLQQLVKGLRHSIRELSDNIRVKDSLLAAQRLQIDSLETALRGRVGNVVPIGPPRNTK